MGKINLQCKASLKYVHLSVGSELAKSCWACRLCKEKH